MESKKRLSSGRDAARLRDPSPAALRRLTSSPTGRLSLLRPRRSSESTSRLSIETESPQSCVTRETSQDECALHRFIVWAAVKRNACERMTASERLECPLLRCRKRFPNHELMLKHLYACDELTTGEYWCYDCARAERFTDAKCKRCLGHPTKRRKILTMAKTFFSHLGHKHRRGAGLADLDLDEDGLLPPPSYDSLHLANQEAELFSNEILEIDSTEIPLPRVVPPSQTASSHAAVVAPQPLPTTAAHVLRVTNEETQAARLNTTMPLLGDAELGWEAAVSGQLADLAGVRCQNLTPERPSLQLDTAGLGQYRAKARSKALAPSSSVRSTTSTTSTASTDTTSSSRISPMSNWSGAWSGIDTTLTSPADDLTSPGGLLHSNSLRFAKGKSYDSEPSIPLDEATAAGLDDFLFDGVFSELPGDYPIPHPLPATLPEPRAEASEPQYFSFDGSISTELSLTSNMAFTDDHAMDHLDLPAAAPEDTIANCVEATSFVGHAWDTIRAHVASSMDKLKHFTHNPLVDQLRLMPHKTIASTGLSTLRDIINGETPSSAIDLLCFVHVAYSFSLVVHEQDAQSQAKKLFIQAFSYRQQLPPEISTAYGEVVDAIWYPGDISAAERQALLLDDYASLMSRGGSGKGKERQAGYVPPLPDTDSLVSIAQYFLDELEFSALPGNAARSIDVFTSELWARHLEDPHPEHPAQSPFAVAMSYILRLLSQKFADVQGFGTHMKGTLERVNSGSITSVRRAELELLQAGKRCMMSKTRYFDEFVPYVRQQCDPLYEQHIPGSTPRAAYYGFGINLIEQVLHPFAPDGSQTDHQMEDNTSLEKLFEGFSTSYHDSSFDHLLTSDMGLDDPMGGIPTISPSNLGEMQQQSGMSVGSADEAMGYMAALSPLPGASSSQAGMSRSPSEHRGSASATEASGSKVEANDCCDICGYRPKGDPQWFKGSMAKHKKLQHANTPPKIYKCPFPGCTSQYKNRPDNLRQHQLDKGHFVEEEGQRRPKRKKVD